MAAIGEKPFPTTHDIGGDASRPSTQDASSATSVSSDASAGSTMPASPPTATTRNDDMVGRVAQGAHQTIDRLAETAAPHLQRLQQGVGVRAQHARELRDQWAESLRCTVREKPLAAVATALALGVVIARLTQR
jgi:ElaB/YqjD/DUF883 family membrane-anchored ribosome-binding protein